MSPAPKTEKPKAKTPSKSKSKKVPEKEEVPRPNHPKMPEMITTALFHLKKKRQAQGSSHQAIKKCILDTYDVDVLNKRIAFRFRRSLTDLVKSGVVILTQGVGLNGRYKLNPNKDEKTASGASKKRKSVTKPKKMKSESQRSAKTAKKPARSDKAKSDTTKKSKKQTTGEESKRAKPRKNAATSPKKTKTTATKAPAKSTKKTE